MFNPLYGCPSLETHDLYFISLICLVCFMFCAEMLDIWSDLSSVQILTGINMTNSKTNTNLDGITLSSCFCDQ